MKSKTTGIKLNYDLIMKYNNKAIKEIIESIRRTQQKIPKI